MDGDVLKNKLGLTNQKELDDAETLLLSDAYAYFFRKAETEDFTFDLHLLFELHKYFLAPLYTWAGKIRRIDISKDDVLFAPVEYLDKSLNAFEKELRKLLPVFDDSKKIIANKLAAIHNELNALHPFREGNGRTIRLFLDLIASYVGYQPIDWSHSPHTQYIHACKQGMSCEHKEMSTIIYKGLKRKHHV